MSIRTLIENVPGVRWLYESYVVSPGSWLYRKATLSHWSDPALVQQLPRSYQWFFRYCAAQRYAPIGAEFLLHAIIGGCRRAAVNDGIIPLRRGDVTAFLDLHDPRFLRVPAELAEWPDLWRRFVRPGDTFIDVGANHGTAALVAAERVGPRGRVVAIEPQPRLAGLLRKLAARSPAPFAVHQAACGDSSGEAVFHIPLATSGSAGRFRAWSAVSRHRTITVLTRRLDELVGVEVLPGQTFIKLDVEGSELAALIGAGQLIRAARPILMTEMNAAALRAAGTSPAALVKRLTGWGYDRYVTRQEPGQPRPLMGEIGENDIIVLPSSYRP
jgi:FkbM family methyltransferase